MNTQVDVLNILIDRKETISFAESCTGGLCASTLVMIPNASWVLNESYVTYAVSSKIRILGVLPETVDRYTVVSEEVAREMALGVQRLANSSVGVSVTGYAGPLGGDEQNPVGTVCFGICYHNRCYTYREVFSNMDRASVISSAVSYVYNKIKEVLLYDD